MRIAQTLFISFAVSSLVGCVDSPDVETSGDRTATLALSADLLGATDIGGVRFEVTEVACAPGDPNGANNESATTDFEDMYLPGGIPAFEGKPFDADSQHMFADSYFLLPAGCYDVLVTPLDQAGNPSDDCYTAHANGVEVNDGETTEILLISQCEGPEIGGLDVIGTINHPPELENVTFQPSKFVATCDGTEVCVTASDPDGDPLEFVWSQTDGDPLAATVTTTETNPDGSQTQCAEIKPTAKGSYEFNVDVYDLANDDQGNPARIEDLLSAQGDPHESRDSIEFPIYSGVDCPVVP